MNFSRTLGMSLLGTRGYRSAVCPPIVRPAGSDLPQTDGVPVAILDRCPHRFAPLSRGRINGDFVECGYHGLQFNGAGVCVLNPHGNHVIPQAAKVRSFPLVERHDILWIWPGDPALADPAAIPDYGYLVEKTRKTIYGGMLVKANYELIIDNLMDASHTQYVHMDLLGTDAFTRSKHEVVQEGDTVYSKYLIRMGNSGSVQAYFEDRTQMVDYRVNFRWQPPSLVRNSVSLTPVGKAIEEGIQRTGTHIMTRRPIRARTILLPYTEFPVERSGRGRARSQVAEIRLTDQDGP